MSSGSQHPTTNEAGIPVASDEHSLSVGADGPIVMHDHYLMEQMAAFNREMIPDRQPHAKGSGAFGHFEVTHDVSQYTKAAFLQPGTKTDVLIRFPPWQARAVARTRGATLVASRLSSTPKKATSTWWVTIPPCSSCAIP